MWLIGDDDISKLIDLTGKKYGKLTVVRRAPDKILPRFDYV